MQCNAVVWFSSAVQYSEVWWHSVLQCPARYALFSHLVFQSLDGEMFDQLSVGRWHVTRVIGCQLRRLPFHQPRRAVHHHVLTTEYLSALPSVLNYSLKSHKGKYQQQQQTSYIRLTASILKQAFLTVWVKQSAA